MVRALHVPVSGSAQVVQVDALTDYQRLVGGFIEAIPRPPSGLTVYVDEEGLGKNLAPNWSLYVLLRALGPGQTFVGDALIFGGPPTRAGNDRPVTQRVVEVAQRLGLLD